MKKVVKRVLRQFNRKLVYVPKGNVWGSDLWEDLKTIVAKNNPICLDIGANVGQTIEQLLNTFQSPRIHAFEPSDASFAALTKYGNDSRVFLHNVGVGDVAGKISFYEYPSSDLSSFLSISESKESRFSGALPLQTVLKEIVTIDDFICREAIEFIDIVKSDTQGFDFNVLKGASSALRDRLVKCILIELNFVQLYDGQGSVSDIFEFLSSTGYGLVDFYEKERRQNQIQWCNALFSLKSE